MGLLAFIVVFNPAREFISKFKLHPKFSFFLKLLVSVASIFFLAQSKDYNTDNIASGLSNYRLLAAFMGLMVLQLILSSIRSHVLLRGGGASQAKLKSVLLISWGSSFINCIAPSSLFGDLFRIKKLMNLDANLSKDNSIYVSLFSKIFSTLSLVIISVFASTMVSTKFHQLQKLQYTLYVFLFFMVAFYLLKGKCIQLLDPLYAKLYGLTSSAFFHRRLNNFKQYTLNLLGNNYDFGVSLGTSLAIQVFNTISFLMIIYSINPQVNGSLLELVCLIPIGILIMALPISFSGFGVGHIAFSKLLRLIGIQNGSDVFTIYFAFSYLFDLMGAFAFFSILRKSDP